MKESLSNDSRQKEEKLPGRKILIACKVFEDELLASLPEGTDCKIIWIDAGLHADLDRLKTALSEELNKAGASSAEVKVLYGSGCHPDICRMAKRHGAGIPPVKNCIEAFCGDKAKQLEEKRTIIMTPGWIRAWRKIMEIQGWDETDARINMGIYDRILLLDTGVNPLSDEEILAFFEIVQVPVETMPLELETFRHCVCEALK